MDRKINIIGEIDRNSWIANANTYQSNVLGAIQGPPSNAIDVDLKTLFFGNQEY